MKQKRAELQIVKGYLVLWWDCPSCTAAMEETSPDDAPEDAYGKEVQCTYCGKKFRMEDKP